MKLFSIPAFFFGLILGLILIYFYTPNYKEIHVYPTLDNLKDIQYQDYANNCFNMSAQEVKCPINSNDIINIPIQS